MQIIRDFFIEIDRSWAWPQPDRIPLQVIGSSALLLQTDYQRGTNDGDVLESRDVTRETKARLVALAGKGTALHKRRTLYLEFVVSGMPLLPHVPLFHKLDDLNASLRNFEIRVLDVVDVVVSKLRPFRSSDQGDIQAMIERGLVPHDRLVARFRDAVDEYAGGAGADDIPKYVRNLHRIERDFLSATETEIELPGWIE